jgi:hypothetical protein
VALFEHRDGRFQPVVVSLELLDGEQVLRARRKQLPIAHKDLGMLLRDMLVLLSEIGVDAAEAVDLFIGSGVFDVHPLAHALGVGHFALLRRVSEAVSRGERCKLTTGGDGMCVWCGKWDSGKGLKVGEYCSYVGGVSHAGRE